MCISPDEMTSAELEDEIEGLRRLIDKPTTAEYYREYYAARIKGLEELLKERAENGTYDSAGRW